MLSLSLARLLYTLYRFLHLPLQNTLLGLLATRAFLQCLHTFSEDFSSVSIKENIILSLMLVSTNNFKNETALRLLLYNSPVNPGFITFCYIMESHLVSNLVRLR